MTVVLTLLSLVGCAEPEQYELEDASDKSFTPVPVGYYVDRSISGRFTETCRFFGANVARLADQITDGVVTSEAEFLAAAQVLNAKLDVYAGVTQPLSTTCGDLLSALEAVPRQGDCPDVVGAAIHTSNAPLAAAMNAVQNNVDPAMVGAWCHVELVGNAANDPRNIWWAVIYGMQNYSAAAVLHNDTSSPAIWRLRYFVPGGAAAMYSAFLQNPNLAAGYPTGSLFSLSLSVVGASTSATNTTAPFEIAPSDRIWTVIDPDDEEEIHALDTFVAAHVDQGVKVDSDCSSISGFPSRRPSSVEMDGWTALTFERGCR